MTFLNPVWLLAIPLVLLPIVIHLLNQRRHKTIAWGAMQFLLSAKRMSRGMARLKHWLIMASRMLVIAGLIFAISRPLSSGWIGSLTGGRPETVLVLLDRSASMQQQQIETGETKLSTGLKKIVETLQTLGGANQIYLIESCGNRALQVGDPKSLLDLPDSTVTESQADIAAMLQTALTFVADNQTGRTDIWICSDGAANDWDAESSRWTAIKSGFATLEGVRFHVLNFSGRPKENLSVVVDRVERSGTKEKSELVIDLTVRRTGVGQRGAQDEKGSDPKKGREGQTPFATDAATINVPVTLNINGLRSVMNVAVEGDSASVVGHRIPIDSEMKTGWGEVELPADSSASDNSYFFTFADPPPRRTVIVSSDERAMRAIEMAAATAMQSGVEYRAVQISPDRVGEIEWQQTALVVWHAPLPTDTVARQLMSFVESGRTVIFLPPDEADGTVFGGAGAGVGAGSGDPRTAQDPRTAPGNEGVGWGAWQRVDGPGQSVGFWNSDEDLLGKTRDGQALPVNDLLIYRNCLLSGETRVLARLENGSPLLVRLASNAGRAYFLTTLPVATHSSLDREGVTLFVMVQRAIAAGAESLGAARQFEAGSIPSQSVSAMPVLAAASGEARDAAALAGARPYRAGVYGDAAQMVALNRPAMEDASVPLAKSEMDTLFQGLDYHMIDDQLGNQKSLASEIWRVFVALMGIALLVEALLCMPEKPVAKPAAVSETPARAAA